MIAIVIITVLFVVFLLLLVNKPPRPKKPYKVVKAGEANCVRPHTIELRDFTTRKFVFKQKVVDPADYDIFIVQGDSMSIAGIKDGDVVFTKKLYSSEKYGVNGSPVLIFEIDKDIPGSPVEFKLRKFLSYIDENINFDQWFNELKDSSKDRDIIFQKYSDCVNKYKNSGDYSLIVSLTLDIKNDTISYSFHPVKFLYGIVEFILPKDKLPQ
jgi:hypothetical protein